MTTSTTATTANIYRLFYTHKRTQMLLESGWVNAQGVKVEGVKVKSVEKVSITCNSTDKVTGEITTKFLNCVHVVYRSASGKRCSQFISCRAYLARATEKRREESLKYQAYQNFSNASVWSVYPKPSENKKVIPSPQQNDAAKIAKPPRTVTTVKEAVVCDCPDFEEQSEYLGQHPYLWEKVIKGYSICKHSLTVLNHLGFDSLGSYLKAWRPGGRLNKLGAVMNQTTRRSA